MDKREVRLRLVEKVYGSVGSIRGPIAPTVIEIAKELEAYIYGGESEREEAPQSSKGPRAKRGN